MLWNAFERCRFLQSRQERNYLVPRLQDTVVPNGVDHEVDRNRQITLEFVPDRLDSVDYSPEKRAHCIESTLQRVPGWRNNVINHPPNAVSERVPRWFDYRVPDEREPCAD